MLRRRFKLIKQGLDDGATLNDLNDVSASSPSNGQTLIWNGSAWTVGDHGDIAGLGDHDHTQYARHASAETISASWTFTAGQKFNDAVSLIFGTDNDATISWAAGDKLAITGTVEFANNLTFLGNLNVSAATITGLPRTVGAAWGSASELVAANCKTVYVRVPFGGTITESYVLTEGGTGSCVIDVWKDTYANFPPTVADTITAGAKPTISSGTKDEDTTLTGWTTAVSEGDVLAFKVDSTSTFTGITILLTIE